MASPTSRGRLSLSPAATPFTAKFGSSPRGVDYFPAPHSFMPISPKATYGRYDGAASPTFARAKSLEQDDPEPYYGRIGQDKPTVGSRFKTEICRNWSEKKSCRYGGTCVFAHGRADLRTRSLAEMARADNKDPADYRTVPCFTFVSAGCCPYYHRCGFIHDPRVLAASDRVRPIIQHLPGSTVHTPLDECSAVHRWPRMQHASLKEELPPAARAYLPERPAGGSSGCSKWPGRMWESLVTNLADQKCRVLADFAGSRYHANRKSCLAVFRQLAGGKVRDPYPWNPVDTAALGLRRPVVPVVSVPVAKQARRIPPPPPPPPMPRGASPAAPAAAKTAPHKGKPQAAVVKAKQLGGGGRPATAGKNKENKARPSGRGKKKKHATAVVAEKHNSTTVAGYIVDLDV